MLVGASGYIYTEHRGESLYHINKSIQEPIQFSHVKPFLQLQLQGTEKQSASLTPVRPHLSLPLSVALESDWLGRSKVRSSSLHLHGQQNHSK